MEPKKSHHILVWFFVPLHVVWSVLFRVLAPEATIWLAKTLPVANEKLLFDGSKTVGTKRTTPREKAMKNWAKKRCLILGSILFEVTWAFWKMCHTKPSLSFYLLVRSKNPRVLCYKLLNPKWQQSKKKLRSCKLIYLCAFACEFSSPGDSRKLFHNLSRRKVSHPCVSSCESPILSRLGTDDRTP